MLGDPRSPNGRAVVPTVHTVMPHGSPKGDARRFGVVRFAFSWRPCVGLPGTWVARCATWFIQPLAVECGLGWGQPPPPSLVYFVVSGRPVSSSQSQRTTHTFRQEDLQQLQALKEENRNLAQQCYHLIKAEATQSQTHKQEIAMLERKRLDMQVELAGVRSAADEGRGSP